VNVIGRIALLATLFASATSAFAQNFSGTYSGSIEDLPATLVLFDAAGVLTGHLTVEGGYTVQLRGSSAESGAEGGASSQMGVGTFALRASENGVLLALEEMAPVSGSLIRTELPFTKSSSNIQEANAEDALFKRDPRLIGIWQGSRIHHAGDMALRLNAALVLNADGTFTEKSDFADRGTMSMTRQGEWGSSAGSLRVKPRGSPDWLLLGRYQVKGDQLVLIDHDGRSEVWQRP
jgi:hypothetical protein